MSRIALLVRESANRVYTDQAALMLVAEVEAVVPTASDVGVERIGGVEYVSFEVERYDEVDRFIWSNLSATHAVFEHRDDASFTPLEVTPLAFFDHDLITIQRYPGKTNEQFTHLLLNVTLAASTAAHGRAERGERVSLLDPVAGRGTTLNRALMYGFDATGIEMAEADVDQYRTFIVNYLKQHRIKHKARREQVKKGPLAGTSRFGVDIARSLDVELVRGDATRAAELLPGRRFDLMVGDLPYGVQHRAAATKETRRSPADFLTEALPGWAELLRKGGAVGLSWNLRTLGRDEVAEALTAAGLSIVDHPSSFEHVVDRSITRDLIVATR